MNHMFRNPQSSDDDEKQLPLWLRGVPLPARPRSHEALSAEAPPEGSQGAGLPAFDFAASTSDWGQSSTSVSSDEAEAAIPDWLRDLQSEISDVEEDLPGVDDQPDWLASLSADETAYSSPMASGTASGLPAASDDVELPDWLTPATELPPHSSAVNADNVDTPSQEQTDDTSFQTPPESASAQPASRFQMPVGATDWLRSLGQEPEPESSEVSSQPPSASAAEHIEPAPREESTGEEDILGWLRDVSPEELERDITATTNVPSSTDVSGPVESAPVTDDQLPDWLTVDAATSSSAAHEEPVEGTDEQGIPDWLRDVSSEELERDIAGIGSDSTHFDVSSREEVLSLDEDLSPGQSESGEASLSDAENLMPDWLRREMTTSSSAADTALSEESSTWLGNSVGEHTAPEEREAPAWLGQSDLPATPSGEGDTALPAWLESIGEQPPIPGDVPAPSASADEEGLPPADEIDTALPNWLQSIEEQPLAPADTSAPIRGSTDEDLPPWLTVDTGSAPSSASSADLPGWLRDEEITASQPGSSDVVDSEALPSWLTAAADAGTTAGSPPLRLDEAGEDWLQSDTRQSEAATPSVPEEDIPDWLKGETQTPPASDAADVPAWLQDVSEAAPPATDTPASNLPPWMADTDDDFTRASSISGDAGLPAWLRGAENDVDSAPPPSETSELSETPDLSVSEEQTMPSWLRTGQQEIADQSVSESQLATPSSESSDFFGGADLPSWLRPSEPEPAAKSAEALKLDWLSRLGMQEEEGEGAAVTTATPEVVLPRPGFQRSPAQIEAAALLQRLVANPFPEAAPVAAPAEPSLWQRVGMDRILYIILAVVLLLSLLFPSMAGFLQTTNAGVAGAGAAAGTVDALNETINQLSSDDIVLLAYEWDAQRSGELVPLERTIAQHLIERDVRLVLVSTDPQGTLLSFDLRNALQAGGYEGKGIDYVLLGYRPGGELALRNMAQSFERELRSDFNGQDATTSALATDLESGEPRLRTLDDLALIVVMADQPHDVQAWMEQIHTSAPTVPLAFLLPSETVPVVRPYLRVPGVQYLAGKQGALAYEALSSEDNTVQAAILQASTQQHFATLAFIALVVIGGTISVILRLVQRGRGKA